MPLGKLRDSIGHYAAPPVHSVTGLPRYLNKPSALQDMTARAIALDANCDLDKINTLIAQKYLPKRLGALVLQKALSLYNLQTADRYKELKGEIEFWVWQAAQASSRAKAASDKLSEMRVQVEQLGDERSQYSQTVALLNHYLSIPVSKRTDMDWSAIEAAGEHLDLLAAQGEREQASIAALETEVAIHTDVFKRAQEEHDRLTAPVAKEAREFKVKVAAYQKTLEAAFKEQKAQAEKERKLTSDEKWQAQTEFAIQMSTIDGYVRRARDNVIAQTLNERGIKLPPMLLRS